MAIGERIHHFRLLRGFTQKYLGQQLGFSESQADVRIAQYEKGARSPKENYLTFCPLPPVISGKRAKSFKTTLQMIYPNPLHLDN